MTLKRSLFRGITNIAFAGIFILPATKTAAQEFPKPQMMRKFRADSLVWDEQKNDGSFKIREEKSQKWGLYQWLYRGLMTRELIAPKYDSLDFILFSAPFSAVYQKGKVGFHQSPWVFEAAEEFIPCQYDDFAIKNVDSKTYLAVKSNGRWFWVSWEDGVEHLTSSKPTLEALMLSNIVSSSHKNQP